MPPSRSALEKCRCRPKVRTKNPALARAKRQALKIDRAASSPRMFLMVSDALAKDFSKIAAEICIAGKEYPQKRQHMIRMAIGSAVLEERIC